MQLKRFVSAKRRVDDPLLKAMNVLKASFSLGDRKSVRRTPVILMACGVVALLLCEVFVFNLPYWETRNLTTYRCDDYVLGDGLESSDDGLLKVAGDDAYMEIHADDVIRYLYLESNSSQSDDDIRSHYVLATQQIGTAGWYNGGKTDVISSRYSDSRIIHVDNNATAVRIDFTDSVGSVIPVSGITVNPHIGFSFDIARMTAMAMLLVMVVALRPSSSLYRIRLTERFAIRDRQLWTLISVGVVEIGLIAAVWHLGGGRNAALAWPDQIFAFKTDYDQYARLGDALIHGRTYLDLPVPDSLSDMANPYDPDLRALATDDGRNPIYWDHAFYNGRYYSYFGVVPAVLFYIPYQLLTGRWLTTTWAVLLLGVLVEILMMVLVVQVVRTYFPKTSLGSVILAILMMNLGSSVYYQVFTANFYSVPGLTSLGLTFAALSLWLCAKRHRLSRGLIACGSLCMALNLGSRPQFILAAVLALPIFWKELVHDRLFLSARSIGNDIAAFAPFIAVFIPLLAYNKLRFDGWFDFGASYNLTGFDMNRTVFPLRNILLLIYYFLFQPMTITGVFPFVGKTATPLPVWSPVEPTPGGLFMLCPYLLLVGLLPVLLRGRDLFPHRLLVAFCAVLAGVILLVDAFSCGLAWRYYLDFAWLICMMALFALFGFERAHVPALRTGSMLQDDRAADGMSSYCTTVHRVVLSIILLAVVLSSLSTFCSLFMTERLTPMIDVNPRLFFEIKRWFLPLS